MKTVSNVSQQEQLMAWSAFFNLDFLLSLVSVDLGRMGAEHTRHNWTNESEKQSAA